MDTTRRGFLKLLGLGGAAAAVGGPALFSSGGSDLLIGAADHFVFDVATGGPVLSPQAKAHFMWLADDMHSEYDRVSRLALSNPKAHKRVTTYTDPLTGYPKRKVRPPQVWSPHGDTSVYQVNCPVPKDEDPHIAFFMAADDLRRKIDADVQEFAKELSRHSLAMVTVVDVPIMAFPHPESGFYLETQIRQYATRRSDITNPGQAVSSHGEVPIETPNDISFKYLMLMQEELRGMGMLANEAKARKRQAREAFRRSMGSMRA